MSENILSKIVLEIQAEQAVAQMAAMMAAYHRHLIAQGVPSPLADKLAIDYQGKMMDMIQQHGLKNEKSL